MKFLFIKLGPDWTMNILKLVWAELATPYQTGFLTNHNI